MSSDKAQALFKEIEGFVAESRSLLQQGALMELAGLDDHVRSLCEEVLALSQEERLRYAGELQTLFDALKGLGEDMAAQRDAMAGDIRNLSTHRKASVAYRVADPADKGRKEEA